MRKAAFSFKRFFQQVDIPQEDQAQVRESLERGLERYRDENQFASWYSHSELLCRPYAMGFGALEVIRHSTLPVETRLKLVRYTIIQVSPAEDYGIPHGLPAMQSFLAALGMLNAPGFGTAMVMADIQGDIYDDWHTDEVRALLDWLIAKVAMPDQDRLWWLWYLLSRCEKPDMGKALFQYCLSHPAWSAKVKNHLCQILLDERPTLKPPAQWRATQAALMGDESAFDQALAEIDPAELPQLDATKVRLEDEPTPPIVPSFAFISSLLRGSDMLALTPAYLKRQAIIGLATLGEEPLALCQIYLGQHDYYTDAINEGVADVIRAHRQAIPDDAIRELVERALGIGKVNTRKAFYQLGADLISPEYWERARSDNANSIRVWAAKQVADKPKKPRKKQGRRKESDDIEQR